MPLKPKSTFNVPNTTICVCGLVLNFSVNPDAKAVHIGVEALDESGGHITFPRPIASMTTEEQAAFCAAVTDALEQAALPYLNRVLGFSAEAATVLSTTAEVKAAEALKVAELPQVIVEL